MIIKISEGVAGPVSACIAEMAVILNNVFHSYDQSTELEVAEKVSSGPIVMPLMVFKKVPLYLNTTKNAKETTCGARLAVYSKQPESKEPCLRFILEKSYLLKEEMLKRVVGSVKNATFDKEQESTLADFIAILGSLKSDKVSYFYSPVSMENVIQHCMAVIHEFGQEDNPFCVATAYFTILTEK
jgi:hypothetical protein